jgi:hypothetical protein
MYGSASAAIVSSRRDTSLTPTPRAIRTYLYGQIDDYIHAPIPIGNPRTGMPVVLPDSEQHRVTVEHIRRMCLQVGEVGLSTPGDQREDFYAGGAHRAGIVRVTTTPGLINLGRAIDASVAAVISSGSVRRPDRSSSRPSLLGGTGL